MQKKSYGSVTVFWLDREAAIASVRECAATWAASDDNVSRIVLFGSLARGTATASSDADILVILKQTDVALLDRPVQYAHRFLTAGLPAELFVYTEEEVRERPSSIAEHGLRDGVVLAER
ncbi:MAG: nucleotidyltransferase domain-containing protein [Spirochaetota bacterium]